MNKICKKCNKNCRISTYGNKKSCVECGYIINNNKKDDINKNKYNMENKKDE